jgi:hypothetical protein
VERRSLSEVFGWAAFDGEEILRESFYQSLLLLSMLLELMLRIYGGKKWTSRLDVIWTISLSILFTDTHFDD